MSYGDPNRNFTAVTNGDGQTLYVHTVTADTAGEVQTVGQVRTVSTGDVLVKTSRPDVYDVYAGSDWVEMGYSENGDNTNRSADTEDAATTPSEYGTFDPTTKRAAEVKTYLNSLDRDDEDDNAEYNRVVRIEQENGNRVSAIPA